MARRKRSEATESGEALQITLIRSMDDEERNRALERVCDLLLKDVKITTTGPDDLGRSAEPVEGGGAAFGANPHAHCSMDGKE